MKSLTNFVFGSVSPSGSTVASQKDRGSRRWLRSERLTEYSYFVSDDVSACVTMKTVCRFKMREAAVLITSGVILCLLLSLSQAARPGQDIRCGGMCCKSASHSNQHLQKSPDVPLCLCPSTPQPAGHWSMKWSGPSPR